MRTLAALERRVEGLEAEEQAYAVKVTNWRYDYVLFLSDLPDEESEAELCWFLPDWFKSIIGCGADGYYTPPLSPRSRFAADPDFKELYGKWCARHHYLEHEWSMERIPREQRPYHPFDFVTPRGDAAQEDIRREMPQRIKAVLQASDHPLALVLTDWQPSPPDACTTFPSERFLRWRDSRTGRD